jgi:hypothetical protein
MVEVGLLSDESSPSASSKHTHDNSSYCSHFSDSVFSPRPTGFARVHGVTGAAHQRSSVHVTLPCYLCLDSSSFVQLVLNTVEETADEYPTTLRYIVSVRPLDRRMGSSQTSLPPRRPFSPQCTAFQ